MADEQFIKRWSRNKLAKTADAVTDEAVLEGGIPISGDEQAALPEVAQDTAEPVENEAPPDLPPIESLDGDSDYTPFLGKNVPEELARMALRKLWSSDPVFANLDGLNDYDDDYSMLGMVGKAVDTAYKVGKGIVTEDEVDAEEPVVEEEEPVVEVARAEEEESENAQDDESIESTDSSESPFPHGGKD